MLLSMCCACMKTSHVIHAVFVCFFRLIAKFLVNWLLLDREWLVGWNVQEDKDGLVGWNAQENGDGLVGWDA